MNGRLRGWAFAALALTWLAAVLGPSLETVAGAHSVRERARAESPVAGRASTAAAPSLRGPGTTSPFAPARLQSVCTVRVDKTADPDEVVIGEQVEITLRLDAECPPDAAGGQADVVLAIDRSASQGDNGTWRPTIDAATAFVEQLDFERHQVALVTFSGEVFQSRGVLRQALTADREAALAALDAIPAPLPLTRSTNLTAAIETSQSELNGDRARESALPVIVLLSDGEHNEPTAGSPIAAADAAKASGTLIVSIGLGVNEQATEMLRQIASRPSLYFPAPSADDLSSIYRALAGTVGGTGRVTDVTIVDLLPSEVAYVSGSAVPAPEIVTSSQLQWRIDEVPETGWEARYRVTPLVTGTYATNKIAYADYMDADGAVATATFPQPLITVREPGEIRVLLPALMKRYCRPGKPFDVVLVVDTSSSMWGDKLNQTREAARDFLRLLAMPPSRAAIVAFHERPTVVQDLTAERSLAQSALQRLPQGEGSRIDLAVREAAGVLSDGADPEHGAVMVLLTDGRQVGGTSQDALDAAAEARRAGVTIYTVGYGADVDPVLLARMAGDPSRYYNAPEGADLVRIYREIAGALPCAFPDP